MRLPRARLSFCQNDDTTLRYDQYVALCNASSDVGLRLAPAFAQVPQATIERIAALSVQVEELGFFMGASQLDDATYHRRHSGLA